MLGLETRHNITLLFSHLKHSRITWIPDLSSIIFLGANDLGIGEALRKEIIELLFRWICPPSTVFEENRTCVGDLASAPGSVLPAPVSLPRSGAEPVFGARARTAGRAWHPCVWRSVGASVQAETSGHVILRIVLQKVIRTGTQMTCLES